MCSVFECIACGLLQVLPQNAHHGEESWAWPEGFDQASLTAVPGRRSAVLRYEGASRAECSARCMTGAIVGVGCGALLLLVGVVVLVAWLRQRRQRSKEVKRQAGLTTESEEALGSNNMQPGLCASVCLFYVSVRDRCSFRIATQVRSGGWPGPYLPTVPNCFTSMFTPPMVVVP